MTSVASAAEPSRQTIPKLSSDLGASVFVWGVWALMLLTGIVFVRKFGSSVIPFSDEWDWVPVLTGEEPLTVAWLWSLWGEHRLVLGKLIWLAMLKLTDGNFRSVMVLNILVLSLLAFAMIISAKRLRGWMSYSDAFFPLALLNFGNSFSYWFAALITHIVPIVFVVALLIIIVLCRTQLTLRNAILAGICLTLLPLGSASGLPYIPPLALWLGYVGVRHWRSPVPYAKRNGLVILGLASAALLMLALYFVGYQKHSFVNPSGLNLRASLRTSVQFLSVSLGPATQYFWKYSGFGVFALLLISVVILVRVWLKQPRERIRALGLLLFIAGLTCLTLSFGWGRSTVSDLGGLGMHYTMLSVPGLCCVYFVWEIYGSPTIRRFIQMSLFTIASVLFWQNTQVGFYASNGIHQLTSAFERDLLAGTPPFILSERYWRNIYWWGNVPDPDPYNGKEKIPAGLRTLQHAGVGQFRLMREDPHFRQISLPVVPYTMNQMEWDNGIGKGIGNNSSLTFALEKPQYVYAIRLKYSYGAEAAAPAFFRTFWRNTGQNDFTETERNAHLELQSTAYPPTGSGEQVVTIWVNDMIDQFRITPDNKPCVFKISEIVLLVPVIDS